jgi:hypothetical protein
MRILIPIAIVVMLGVLGYTKYQSHQSLRRQMRSLAIDLGELSR